MLCTSSLYFDKLCEINQELIKSMRVDGGGTNSDFLMQFQADNREYLLRKWHRAVERAKGWELE